jgi:hypothetical protein
MAPVTRITKGSRKKPRIVPVRADRLTVVERVQRGLIPARAKALAGKLDLDALGIFTVSERNDGQLVVLDGQHRLEALLIHDMGEWEVTCHIYRGLSEAQEAALFRRLNDTRKITPFDDFDKGLVEGDPEALAINAICQKHGLQVTHYGADGHITCIQKLRQLYVSSNGLPSGAILDDALGLVLEAWGVHYPAVEKSILGGVAIVLSAYGKEIDRGKLVEKLAKEKGGASGLLGRARMLREIRTTSVERLVASVIVGTYNKGRGSGKLAEL